MVYEPISQGLAIGNSETIRSVHNGFSRQEPFFNDGQDGGGKKEDVFHFVAYLRYDEKASWLCEAYSTLQNYEAYFPRVLRCAIYSVSYDLHADRGYVCVRSWRANVLACSSLIAHPFGHHQSVHRWCRRPVWASSVILLLVLLYHHRASIFITHKAGSGSEDAQRSTNDKSAGTVVCVLAWDLSYVNPLRTCRSASGCRI